MSTPTFSTGAREIERRFLASAPALASGPMTVGDITYEFVERFNPDGIVRSNNLQFSTPIEDQGPIGSCTGMGTTRVAESILSRVAPPIALSQLMVYWNARKRGGLSTDVDSGAIIRDALDSLRHDGVCQESEWPYIPSLFSVEPSASAFASAALRKGARFERIRIDKQDYAGTIRRLKSALLEGQIVLGSDIRRVMFRPTGPYSTHADQLNTYGDPFWEEQMGKHCWTLEDFDTTIYPAGGGSFIVSSSWGTAWGNGGRLAIPFYTLVQDAFEAWLLRDFAGAAIGPSPEVPLTPDRIQALRVLLTSMGLAPSQITGLPPGYDDQVLTLQCAAFGLLRAEGCTVKQIAQVVDKPVADISAFAANQAHIDRIAAWAVHLG